MTAEDFGKLLQVRRIGPGRWTARCPSHADHSPSLSVAEGTGGRVLVLCRAGCETKQVLAALGPTVRDLFAGPPATPQEAAVLAAERNVKAANERRQPASDRASRDRVFKLERVRDSIGGRSARNPNDDRLAALFHQVCDRWHEAETALYADPQDGPMRQPEPLVVHGWISDVLLDLGGDFYLKEAACSAA